MDYSELTDEELQKMIVDADLAERFLDSPQGKLVKVAADRIVERAIAEFALSSFEILKDVEKLAELRVIIKKYKFGLFEEIKQIAREGFLVFEELQNRRHQALNDESGNAPEKGEDNG